MKRRLALFCLLVPVICSISVGQQQRDVLHNSGVSDIVPVPESVALRVKFQYLDALAELPCPPVTRERRAQDVQQSRANFGSIAADTHTYRAILEHLGLQKEDSLKEDEKLIVYCLFQKLQSLQVTRKGAFYRITRHDALAQPGHNSSGYIEVDDRARVQIMGVITNRGFGSSQGLTGAASTTQPTGQSGGSDRQQSPPLPQKLSSPELRYQLLEKYQVAFCYPFRAVTRLGEAVEMVRRDSETYQAIMQHLGLPENRILNAEQQRAVYQEFLKLNAIELQPLVTRHEFALSVSSVAGGPGRGTRIFGIIDDEGRDLVLYRVPVSTTCAA